MTLRSTAALRGTASPAPLCASRCEAATFSGGRCRRSTVH